MMEALGFFKKHGFSVIGTGGGCKALYREADERYCLITLGEDGSDLKYLLGNRMFVGLEEIPKNLDEPLLVGIYQRDAELLLGLGDDAVFFSHGVDHKEAVKIAKKWLDEGCEHPCGTNGHTAPEGRNWCAVCNTFIW